MSAADDPPIVEWPNNVGLSTTHGRHTLDYLLIYVQGLELARLDGDYCKVGSGGSRDRPEWPSIIIYHPPAVKVNAEALRHSLLLQHHVKHERILSLSALILVVSISLSLFSLSCFFSFLDLLLFFFCGCSLWL
jgi:hypothetical protein